MPKILITAGGTEEKIDGVRSITNSGSGQLGAMIADQFLELGFEVIYVHAKNAILPKNDCRKIPIIGVQDLEIEILKLLDNENLGLIVHTMAISDFYVGSLQQNNQALPIGEGKISSSYPATLTLIPAPKIIRYFKKRSQAILIGFKLLAGSTDNQLLNASLKQMQTAHSDYVIANHKEDVSSKEHKAYLCTKQGFIQSFKSKQEISQGIVDIYLKRGIVE